MLTAALVKLEPIVCHAGGTAEEVAQSNEAVLHVYLKTL
jgi:hypothetical protein